MPPDKDQAKEILFIVTVFVVALALRAFNVLQFKALDPVFDSAIPGSDMHAFKEWAREILATGWLDPHNTPPLQAPLYPYLIALLMRLFGDNVLFIKLAQAAIGSVTCVLVYMVGKRAFHRKTGMVAALMAVVYGMFLFYEAFLLSATLVTFLCLLAVLSLLVARAKATLPYSLAAGIAMGLTTIAAPQFVLFVPPALLWLWFLVSEQKRAAKLAVTAMVIAGFLAAVAPVTLKNYFVGRQPVLISKNGGICFYIGNCRDSSGTLTITPSMMRVAPDFYSMTPRERAEIDWAGEAIEHIQAHPGGFLKLLAQKCIMFWAGYEIPNNTNYYLSRQFSPLLRLPLLPFWIVAPLALVGIGVSLRQWPRQALLLVFMVCYTFSVVAFFVLSRLRLPLVPFLLIFAGHTILWWIEKLKSADWKRLGLSVVAFCAVCAFTFVTRSGYIRENDYANLGIAYQEKGRCDLAVTQFAEALEVDPYYYPARRRIVDCLLSLGEHERALEASVESVRLHPRNAEAYWDVARVLLKKGDTDSAIAILETAVTLNPDSAVIRRKLEDLRDS